MGFQHHMTPKKARVKGTVDFPEAHGIPYFKAMFSASTRLEKPKPSGMTQPSLNTLNLPGKICSKNPSIIGSTRYPRSLKIV